MVVSGGMNQRLLRQLALGQYVVKVDAVAEAIIRRAGGTAVTRVSQVLVAPKLDSPPPGAHELDAAPRSDLS
jgi:hypothetical protein